MPICQVKRCSNLTNKKHHPTCMMLCHENSRKGKKKINNICAAASHKRQRVSREKRRKILKELEKNLMKIMTLLMILMINVMLVFELVAQFENLTLF